MMPRMACFEGDQSIDQDEGLSKSSGRERLSYSTEGRAQHIDHHSSSLSWLRSFPIFPGGSYLKTAEDPPLFIVESATSSLEEFILCDEILYLLLARLSHSR